MVATEDIRRGEILWLGMLFACGADTSHSWCCRAIGVHRFISPKGSKCVKSVRNASSLYKKPTGNTSRHDSVISTLANFKRRHVEIDEENGTSYRKVLHSFTKHVSCLRDTILELDSIFKIGNDIISYISVCSDSNSIGTRTKASVSFSWSDCDTVILKG